MGKIEELKKEVDIVKLHVSTLEAKVKILLNTIEDDIDSDYDYMVDINKYGNSTN